MQSKEVTKTLQLHGYQRAALFRQAHALKPIATIGKSGLTASVVHHIETEITARELIKIRFVEFKDERRSLAEEAARRVGAVLVGIIGYIAVLYRPAEDPELRRVTIPRRESRV